MNQNQTKFSSVEEANQFLSQNQRRLGTLPAGFIALVKQKPRRVKNVDFYHIDYFNTKTSQEEMLIGGVSYLSDDGVIIHHSSNPEGMEKYVWGHKSGKEEADAALFELYIKTKR